jgi:hypothetical protein
VWSPATLVLFFIGMSHMETPGDHNRATDLLRRQYLPTLAASTALWVPVQAVNFKYVLPQYQILFTNAVGLLWSVFISRQANVAHPPYAELKGTPHAHLPSHLRLAAHAEGGSSGLPGPRDWGQADEGRPSRGSVGGAPFHYRIRDEGSASRARDGAAAVPGPIAMPGASARAHLHRTQASLGADAYYHARTVSGESDIGAAVTTTPYTAGSAPAARRV